MANRIQHVVLFRFPRELTHEGVAVVEEYV